MAPGSGYTYHIRYPELQPDWRVLDQAMRAYAAAHSDFLDARKADENAAGPAYNLILNSTSCAGLPISSAF